MSDRTDKSIERQERKTRRQFEGVTFVLTLAETMQLYAKPILVHQIASQRSAIGHSSLLYTTAQTSLRYRFSFIFFLSVFSFGEFAPSSL